MGIQRRLELWTKRVLCHCWLCVRHHRGESDRDARRNLAGRSRRHRCLRRNSCSIRLLCILRSSKQLDHSVVVARAVADPGNLHGTDSGVSMACWGSSAWWVQRNDKCPLFGNWLGEFWRRFYRLLLSCRRGDPDNISGSPAIGELSLWLRCGGDKRRCRAHANVGIQRCPYSDSGVCRSCRVGRLERHFVRLVGQLYQPLEHGPPGCDLTGNLDCVGGRSSLLAVLLSTVTLRSLADTLAVKGGEYAFLIMGILLLVTMLFFPAGIVVTLARRLSLQKSAHGKLKQNRAP